MLNQWQSRKVKQAQAFALDISSLSILSLAISEETRRPGGNSTKGIRASQLLPQKSEDQLLLPFVP